MVLCYNSQVRIFKKTDKKMMKQSTANKKLIKKINTNAILNVIRINGMVSRAEIAKILKLNPATVSSNVVDLLELGLIRERGIGDSSGGRKPIMLELDYDNVYVIGVHTELTHANIGIVDLKGRIIDKKVYAYGEIVGDGKAILNKVTDGIDDVLKSTKVDKNKIIGIGVGLHGLVDSTAGESVFAPKFHWHHVAIGDLLFEKYDMPIFVDNDVRVMALGEKWFGRAQQCENFILINVGEGIGGALFINGKLYSGKAFGAGEVGHIKVTHKQLQCECGNMGCLTMLASEEAIIKSVKETECIEGNVTLDKIINCAKKGDEQALDILQNAGDYIGTGVGIIINIINPETIILTGTVLKAKEFFFDNIIEGAKKSSIIDNFAKTTIDVSAIEEDLGVIGASTLVLEDLFSV